MQISYGSYPDIFFFILDEILKITVWKEAVKD